MLNILANKIGMEIGVTTLLPVGRGLIVPLSLEPFKYFWDIEGFGKLTSRKINMLVTISFNILERNNRFLFAKYSKVTKHFVSYLCQCLTRAYHVADSLFTARATQLTRRRPT